MVFEGLKERFGRQVVIERPDGSKYSFKGFGSKKGLERKGKKLLNTLPKAPSRRPILPGQLLPMD